MKPLIFKPVLLKSGKVWPNQWVSECGTYSMACYSYLHGLQVKPYYMGYRKLDGKRLTSEKGMTEKEVIAVLNKHAEENI